MRKCAAGLLTLVLGVILLVPPAMAHHSFAAEYDATKQVTMQGFVTKVEWTNPHVWMAYRDFSGGEMTNWGAEMGPPHGLQQRGWSRTTMKLGDEVIINGTAAKNGSNRVNARSVTMAATGQKLGAASSEGETP